jgi:hypothetical protein
MRYEFGKWASFNHCASHKHDKPNVPLKSHTNPPIPEKNSMTRKYGGIFLRKYRRSRKLMPIAIAVLTANSKSRCQLLKIYRTLQWDAVYQIEQTTRENK